MNRRRRPGPAPDDDADRVHREILEHLDRNPPPRRPTRASKPVPKRTGSAPEPPRPPETPRLMLRKMRVEPALRQLETFVRGARHRGLPKVIVVVGKGHRSGVEGPVIGPAVRSWCDRHPDLVTGVHVALPSEGGDGALVLHLARPA